MLRRHPGCPNPRGYDVNLRSGPQMREYQAIVRRIAADGPRRILDWGCGYGQISHLLWRAGLEVTAFDYRPDADETVVALDRYPHLRAHVSTNPRRLPFRDGAFDAVLSCGVLEHVEDPDTSLEEIGRVLVPDGTFYVYKLPNRRSYLEAVARRAGLYYHGALEHDRVYDERGAWELLARHSFVVQEARRANMLPLTLTGRIAERAALPIWLVNRGLSSIPGLNRFATNLEVVARRQATAARAVGSASASVLPDARTATPSNGPVVQRGSDSSDSIDGSSGSQSANNQPRARS